jgi:hypothetical protein
MRGVCYLVWGDSCGALLDRSIASLRRFHPDLPVRVERLEAKDPREGLLLKARMFGLSPFSTTLFLDADTIVLGNLDYGFAQAERHGLACCICESPWARRHTGLGGMGDLVEYNTGVLFFSARARPVFEAWAQLAPVLDSSTPYVTEGGRLGRQPCDDQASFALAVHQTHFVPYVLPLNWNFRLYFRSFFGPLKIWHAYQEPPPAVEQLCEYYRGPNSIIQFHLVSIQ